MPDAESSGQKQARQQRQAAEQAATYARPMPGNPGGYPETPEPVQNGLMLDRPHRFAVGCYVQMHWVDGCPDGSTLARVWAQTLRVRGLRAYPTYVVADAEYGALWTVLDTEDWHVAQTPLIGIELPPESERTARIAEAILEQGTTELTG